MVTVDPRCEECVRERIESRIAVTQEQQRGLRVMLESGIWVTLPHPEDAAILLYPLQELEIETSRNWLQKLDSSSLQKFLSTESSLQAAEEEFLRAFGVPPVSFKLPEEIESELNLARHLASVVEDNGFASAIDADCSWKASHIADVWEELSMSNLRISEEEEQSKGSKFGSSTDLSLFDSGTFTQYAASNPWKNEDGSCDETLNSKPMKVHQRSARPRVEDAAFNIRYKTDLCVHYEKFQKCPAGDNCHFAHGQAELRQSTYHPKYRTQDCLHYLRSGQCPYGEACFFSHASQSKAIPKPSQVSNQVQLNAFPRDRRDHHF